VPPISNEPLKPLHLRSQRRANRDICISGLSGEKFMARIKEFERLAEKGDPSGFFNLAMCYATGREGVPLNDEKAISLFKSAAELGDADAAYYVGIGYGSGKGVDQDFRKAEEWFTKASILGHATAHIDSERAKSLIESSLNERN